jgi:hypothetical protein
MEDDLQSLRKLVADKARELAEVGFILYGTIRKHYMACGRKGCRCQADPPRLHGPYYDWTRKVDGKTKTVRLTEEQAKIIGAWINDMRKIERAISEMEKISAQAADKIRK